MRRIEDHRDYDLLVYVLSHDLRAPARALRQYMTLIAGTGEEMSADIRHYLKRMGEVVDRLDGQLDSLLDLSRCATGATVDSLSLKPLVQSAAASLDVPVTCASDLPEVVADHGRMSRLVEELVRNVRDHAGDSPSAHLSFERGSFRLTDGGPGIPDRIHREVFAPFRPVPYPDTPHIGMGLSVVSRITRSLGGKVWLELPDEGGTVVCLHLPLAS